jgi:zona occludens toxin
MINLLLGLPGGGKSYEAVVFHILPALALGRKVITNLALDVEAICALHPEYRPLIEIRTATLKEKPEVDWSKAESLFKRFGIAAREPRHNAYPFSNLEDYGDPWRHPENGSGPLYVIDECHICLPKIGTPVKVEEWFSMHRHEFADVLLITQTYGKINQAVRDIVQVCYRVKKATAFGFNTKYIRKVQDGIRGEVVNTSIREYKSQFFKFYRSNTKSGAGVEMASQDIKPIWKNWTFIGAGLCGLTIIAMVSLIDFKHPFKPRITNEKNGTLATVDARPNSLAAAPLLETPKHVLPGVEARTQRAQEAGIQLPDLNPESADPFKEKGLHLVGHIKALKDGKTFERWLFAVSQNGQYINTISSDDLAGTGYVWTAHSPCSGVLALGKLRRPVSCDTPQIQLIPKGVGGAA